MEMEGSIRSPSPPSTRIAVVTGANRGIGLEVCRQLAGNGLTVVLTARDETRGLAAVEKLNEAGFSDVVFHQLEITDAKSIARLADFLKTRFGKLDILVNNAAVGAVEYVQDPIDSSTSSDQKFSGMDELQRLEWMFQNVRETCDSAKEGVQTNYYGTKHVIQALLPLLKTSSDGRIVNVSSGFGLLRAAARWVLFVTQQEPRILCRHGDCPGRGPPTPWMDALWSSRSGNLATHRLMHARRSRSRAAGAGDERLGPSDGSSDGRTRRPSRQGRDATSAGRRRPRDGAKVLGAAVAADFSQKSRRRGDEARGREEAAIDIVFFSRPDEETAALEPKWAAVAEYCRRHGVERGPVQCRKRWSNLAGDYKKIKEWERAAAASREPSFWAMRNDARRERRLPGFFDREVYDILEGRGRAILDDRSARNAAAEEPAAVRVEEGKEAEVPEAVFDSGRPATEEALFSEDEEEEEEDAPAVPPPPPPPPVIAVPVSEKPEASRQQQSAEQGTSKDTQPEQSSERDAPAQQGGQKRPRTDEGAGEGTADLQSKLIEILDRNSGLVAAQLEAQNQNCELDREQRKDQANSLVLVLGRLADALGRIADKL